MDKSKRSGVRAHRLAVVAVLVTAAVALSILSGCDGVASVLGADPAGRFTTFEEASLAEINFLRTDPAGYAETRLADDYAAGTDNGAYLDVRSRDAVRALTMHSVLGDVADDYAEFMATNDVFGHNERLTPKERCEEAGYFHYSGENLAAGSYPVQNAEADPEAAAIAYVEMLVIDEGVPSLGHRENLLARGHRVVGIGFHRDTDSTYHNYYVQNFGYQ